MRGEQINVLKVSKESGATTAKTENQTRTHTSKLAHLPSIVSFILPSKSPRARAPQGVLVLAPPRRPRLRVRSRSRGERPLQPGSRRTAAVGGSRRAGCRFPPGLNLGPPSNCVEKYEVFQTRSRSTTFTIWIQNKQVRLLKGLQKGVSA